MLPTKPNVVRVVVVMREVTVGKGPGGFEQAVGIRSREQWGSGAERSGTDRHKMGKKQVVGISGQRVQAGGGREVLVEGQEVWEEWTGQVVEDTEWRGKAKGRWRAMEQATIHAKRLGGGHGARQGVCV